jgi:uncharacterized membrane protein
MPAETPAATTAADPVSPEGTDVPGTYKRVFFRGLATLLPTVLTLWVFVAVYGFIDGKIAQPIAGFIKDRLVATDTGNAIAVAVFDLRPELGQRVTQDGGAKKRDEEDLRQKDLKDEVDKKFPSWVGFVLAIVAVFIVGFFIASFVGRSLWSLFEGWLAHIPIVKSVYPGAKQMVEFFLKSEESRRSWSTVVAVEYPRKNVWAIGYITGPGMERVEERQGESLRTVFLPASPTMAGYVIMVPEKEIVALDMTVDEAIRFTISGGVVRPTGKPVSQRLKPAV